MTTLRALSIAAAFGAAALLTGCGEKPQISSSAAVEVPGARPSGEVAGKRVESGTKAWGGDPLPYEARNFQRGDQVSWEKALDTRVLGQNEYVRIGGNK